MAKEFPEDLNPIPTPLTGSERVLADKGTATIDDIKDFSRTGLPAPSDAADAATKGYVDARPGAEKWSEHAATEDVDLDGHKLTGLGEPTDAADAATKGYVDSASPTRIERAGSYVEVKSDGSIEAHMQGSSGRELSINLPKTGQMTMRTVSSSSPSAVVNEIRFGYGPNPSLSLSCSGGTSGEHHIRASLSLNAGRWSYLEQGQTTEQFLSDTTTKAMPATVRSVAHGIHLAKEAHDQRALVEWWEPVWTPVENVDSVSNVECSYTRTYRAAGGSLVTLEGTIEVTPEALADDSLIFTCPLPVPQVGSAEPLGWVGDTENNPGSMCRISGGLLGVSIESANDAVRTASFRISYRAA